MIYLVLGGLVGLIMVASQWWTAQQVQPQSAQRAIILVMGGAAIRWLLVAVVLFAAFRTDFALGLATFASWWGTRWFLLIRLIIAPEIAQE